MNPIQKMLARHGWRLTRIHPNEPIAWSIDDGLDFNFPAVKQCTPNGGLYTVTTSEGRFHITQIESVTHPDHGRWQARLIRHYTERPAERAAVGDTAAEVIAELFKTHNPDVHAEVCQEHLDKAAAHAARGRKTKKG